MNKSERFTFKLDVDDRRLLALLAHRLQRTQSDALRWLVRKAAQPLQVPLDWGDLVPEISLDESEGADDEQ